MEDKVRTMHVVLMRYDAILSLPVLQERREVEDVCGVWGMSSQRSWDGTPSFTAERVIVVRHAGSPASCYSRWQSSLAVWTTIGSG